MERSKKKYIEKNKNIMEKKNNQSSPHGWLIILMIVFSICVLLMTLVFTVAATDVNRGKRTILPKPIEKTQKITGTFGVRKGSKMLSKNEKTNLIQEAMRRYFNSIPPIKVDLAMHGMQISNIKVGKNFYIYDCQMVPMSDHMVVTILMEMPEISIEFKDRPDYSQCCPTINPYIHVIELSYSWGYNKKTYEAYNGMKLMNIKLYMVQWKDNLYKKAYEQVRNSPLYESKIPPPIDLQEKELYDFIKGTTLFERLPMVFDTPLIFDRINEKTMPLTLH